jgi:hypothetical protein
VSLLRVGGYEYIPKMFVSHRLDDGVDVNLGPMSGKQNLGTRSNFDMLISNSTDSTELTADYL